MDKLAPSYIYMHTELIYLDIDYIRDMMSE